MMENSNAGGEQVKPFACPACTSRFTRQENLSRHIASVHRKSNLRPFPCPQCEVSFSRSDLRKRHVRKFHPQPEDAAEEPKPVQANHKYDEMLHLATASSQQVSTAQLQSTPPFAESVQTSLEEHNTAPIPSLFSAQSISWVFKVPQFIADYFEKFHPFFPVLHKPSFDVTSTREPLLQAVACNGAICHSEAGSHDISLALFEAGLQSLDKYVQEAPYPRLRQVWVLQAYLLFEHYAIYACRDDLFKTGLRIHRTVVDSARQYQMLQDGDSVGANSPEAAVVPTEPSNISPEHGWQMFIDNESRKRVMYCLYHLDSQMAICCNLRPMLSALELKYELPCRDDIWAAPSAEVWSMLTQTQEVSFNEEHDYNANGDPRPAYGDLYEILMQLMNPDPPARQLGLLWRSSFACMMLIMQIQMMLRDLTVASIFLYNNISFVGNRHNLSIISENNRAPIMRALEALSDLMPKIDTPSWAHVANNNLSAPTIDHAAWRPVWVAWHYTAMCLTHQEALLSSGIVEHSLPAAISTAWELGKPRAKQHRDIYEDRDVIRLVDRLEIILSFLNHPPTEVSLSNAPGSPVTSSCIEDPFTTMLGFKACMSGWRVVRLMTLTLERNAAYEALQLSRPSIYSWSARVVLSRIMGTIFPECGNYVVFGGEGLPQTDALPQIDLTNAEARYLEWTERVFSIRNIWHTGKWIVAVISETRREGPT